MSRARNLADLLDASGDVKSGALDNAISDVVGDTTPQLGGNLDLNSKDVTGTGAWQGTAIADGYVASASTWNTANTTANAALPKAGGTMTGDLNLGDNNKIQLGASQDFQLFHSGTNSIIRDAGTGGIYIEASSFTVTDAAGNENMVAGTENGGVTLSFDNSQKLETQSGGVGITGDLTASGNLISNSDERLKDDIQVIPNALSKIEEIRGVTFTRNDLEDTETRYTGVIAQEVEKVLPEVVGENEEGIKNVAYGNMVGLLIEGMKEQQEIIRSLASRITDLEEG